ncbi:MAG: 2-C-methyl-D-erythritol 2,4-cyclodiphosphate synthase [Gracilibacter sp. BRH_c7a]|nr:MAG: 2-C-methyl-D-erythritol 2,4-cyclodiphosphate synthase [Gracilibacter sp. BRH_c7a]
MKLTHSANIGAIIPAAGQGKRMGGQGNKLLLELAGTPILVCTLKIFDACPYIREIIIPAAFQDIPTIKSILDKIKLRKKTIVTEGGSERQDSVYKAIQALSPEVDKIVVHDGARPLLTVAELNCFLEEAQDFTAGIMAVPLKDTIKKIDHQDWVLETPEREYLRAVQTPQIFERDLLEKTHTYALQEGFYATDDAALLEAHGHHVKVFKGSYENIKITTPEDLILAEIILGKRRGGSMRIGQGYDVHALIEGRKLIVGGIQIPHNKGLQGHSDADVLVHAIIDALLGACALGDIGQHFPDSDIRYKDISSLKLLGEVGKLIKEQGYVIGNLDSSIIAQKPKFAPFIEKMRINLAEILDIDFGRISIKATTTEQLGFEGREEGISAQAIVCLLPA